MPIKRNFSEEEKEEEMVEVKVEVEEEEDQTRESNNFFHFISFLYQRDVLYDWKG